MGYAIPSAAQGTNAEKRAEGMCELEGREKGCKIRSLRTDKAVPNMISWQLQLPARSLHKTWPVNSQSARDP